MDRLTCKLCKKRKSKKHFGARYHKTGSYQNGKPVCVECDAKIQVDSVYKSPRNYLSSRFRDMRTRSRRYDIELDEQVNLDYLIHLFEKQNGFCAVSGLPMTWMHEGLYTNHGSRRGTNISVDRIDPEAGYVLDNIRLVCDRVNKMRSNMTDGDLYFWCTVLAKALRTN